MLFGWIACYGLRPVYKEQQVYGVALEMHLKSELVQHIFPIHSLHYLSLISDGSLIFGGPLSGKDRIEQDHGARKECESVTSFSGCCFSNWV